MKQMKKLLVVLFSLALVTALLAPAFSLAAPIKETPYAYIKPSAHYFLVGQEVTFEVVMPATEGYTYEYNMFHTSDRTQKDSFQGVDRVKKSTEPSYRFTPTELGQYFLEVWISDKDYGSLKLQSEVFYCYRPEDEQNPDTLPGRVKAIGAELAALSLPTQYEKALWLHDWLTHNAEYDEPMTIHTPEGVLLQGKGVCESYALAYQMLLAEAGMEGIYVTGYSRGQSHAWNLVNIDGEWTYVDVTWGDPVGGVEGYDYFGLNDALLSRDHDWTYSNCRPPKAETLQYNYLLRNGAVPFQDETEMVQVISQALENREPLIQYTYHGTDAYFDVSYTLNRWLKKNVRRYFVETYRYTVGSRFSGGLEVVYGQFDDYIKFTSEEDFTAQVREVLAAKPAVLKAYYLGEDDYFDFGSFIRRWLTAHSAEFGITGYSYTYYPVHGVVELKY